MEVWNFENPVDKIVFGFTEAQTFGDVGIFGCLRTLYMNLGSKIYKPRMADLACCKMLTTLCLNIEDPTGTGLNGISKLVNLRELHVAFCDTPNQRDVYPFDEITKLEKLHTLMLAGRQICGCIPKEIHKLTCMTTLSCNATSLTSSIPSEIGQLVNLSNLNFVYNEGLVGELPKELDNLQDLRLIDLNGTPNVGARNVMTHGVWNQDKWHKHWAIEQP
jgi:hypothetical protein